MTDERTEMVRENVKLFGWDFEALEEEGKLAMHDACPIKIGIPLNEKYVDVRPFDMRSMLDQIIAIQEDIDAKRAFVNLTASIGFYSQDSKKLWMKLLILLETLKNLGLTSLLKCDILDENMANIFRIETFVSDCIILMQYERMDSVRVRSIEIFKMRGSEHSQRIHPYEITSHGIVVHPVHEEVLI